MLQHNALRERAVISAYLLVPPKPFGLPMSIGLQQTYANTVYFEYADMSTWEGFLYASAEELTKAIG